MGFTNDLSQFGLTAQAKYTFDIPGVPKLKPNVQAGLGLIYADIDNRREGNRDDSSYLIPLGIGAEYRLTDSILLDGSIMVNFNDLDFRDGDSFVTWFIGVKFPL
jgi:opacity protein-like surface antigen